MSGPQRYVKTKLCADVIRCDVYPRFFVMFRWGGIACQELLRFDCCGSTPGTGRQVRLELTGVSDGLVRLGPCSCPSGNQSEIWALIVHLLFTGFRCGFVGEFRDERVSPSREEIHDF